MQNAARLIPFAAAIFVLVGAALFAAWPVVVSDTDTWYHLSGGRWFWQTGQIPTSSDYFSFIQPPREFANYYWGFQALVAWLHDQFGYAGLIALRTLLFTVTVLCLYGVMIRRSDAVKTVVSVALIIFVVWALQGRMVNVRPHLFSYALMALSIYALDRNHRLAGLLPLAALIWANVHGVQYFALYLIVGAYLIESLAVKATDLPGQVALPTWVRLLGIASLAVVVANPFGADLLLLPFELQGSDVFRFIGEMQKVGLRGLFSFNILQPWLPGQSVSLILAASLVAAGWLAWARKIRISHAIMLAGGLVLLSRASRFTYEFVILAAPLLSHAVQELPAARGLHERRPALTAGACLAACLALVAAPFNFTIATLDKRGPYPFERRGLPVSTASFLQNSGLSGNVFADNDLAGYYNYALAPESKIFMDNQFSLFTQVDAFRVQRFTNNADYMAKYMAEHQVDFVTFAAGGGAPFESGSSAAPPLRPVYFDEAYVLYVNAERHSEFAAEHAIVDFDPFRAWTYDYAKDDAPQQTLGLMERLLVHDPLNLPQLIVAGSVLNGERRFPEALAVGERLRAAYPNVNAGYIISGHALERMGRHREAVDVLQASDGTYAYMAKSKADLHLFAAYDSLEMWEEAYTHIQRAVNPYREPKAEPGRIGALALGASRVGDYERARRYLRMVLEVMPEDDPQYAKYAELLGILEED
jgi:tetratricopeptide (TPR) repeat protein